MPSLTFNYGNWQFWSPYDPSNETFGPQKVSFDGINKLINVAEGVTTLDFQEDVYAAWKEWLFDPTQENTKYLFAITGLGGDPITSETFVGDTYFLENGWRIKPWPTSTGYILDIIGNVYTRETGGNPVVPTSNVSVTLTRSNITETAIAGGAATESRLLDIWRILGLDSVNPQLITDTSITVGDITLTISHNETQDTTTVTRS